MSTQKQVKTADGNNVEGVFTGLKYYINNLGYQLNNWDTNADSFHKATFDIAYNQNSNNEMTLLSYGDGYTINNLGYQLNNWDTNADSVHKATFDIAYNQNSNNEMTFVPGYKVAIINNLIVDSICELTSVKPFAVNNTEGPLNNATPATFSEAVNVCVKKTVSNTMTMSQSLTNSEIQSQTESVNYGLSVGASVTVKAGVSEFGASASASATASTKLSMGHKHTWHKSSGTKISHAEGSKFTKEISIKECTDTTIEVPAETCLWALEKVSMDINNVKCDNKVEFSAVYKDGGAVSNDALVHLYHKVGYSDSYSIDNDKLFFHIESKGGMHGKTTSSFNVITCKAHNKLEHNKLDTLEETDGSSVLIENYQNDKELAVDNISNDNTALIVGGGMTAALGSAAVYYLLNHGSNVVQDDHYHAELEL